MFQNVFHVMVAIHRHAIDAFSESDRLYRHSVFVAHDRRLTEYMEERQKNDRLQEKSITTTVERSNG